LELWSFIGGAVFGGMLGTEYGFGGMGDFDIRSLTTAAGVALISLAGYRFVATRVMA
jgi:hypothetical protein